MTTTDSKRLVAQATRHSGNSENEPMTPETRSLARRPSDIVSQVLDVAQLLRSELNEHLSEFALNDARYSVLKAVDSSGPSGCTQTQVADALRQSESNICTLVERMRSDGLLYRYRSKNDRRKRILLLTEHAKEILSQIETCHDRQMSRILHGLSLEDRQTLSHLLDRLGASVVERQDSERSRNEPQTVSLAPPRPHLFGQSVRNPDP